MKGTMPNKPRHVRTYLHEEELQILAELARESGVRDTLLLSMLAAAGLKAVKEAGYKMELPLRLKISSPKEDPVSKKAVRWIAAGS
jgi:site-specific recombinase XerD